MANLYLISNLRTGIDPSPQALVRKIAAAAKVSLRQILMAKIVKKSVDARKKPKLFHILQAEFRTEAPLKTLPHSIRALEVSTLEVPDPDFLSTRLKGPSRVERVVVVGSGPAGLFAALALGTAGVATLLLERGKRVEERLKDIGRLRSEGKLDTESNICFGEGGAGAYTDGKLYTRIKHPYARWVLKAFTDFGANPSILVDAHPHLGTENLVAIIKKIRARLTELGVEIRFGAKVERLHIHQSAVRGVILAGGEELSASRVILAVGHSARDTLENLLTDGVRMEAKDFAVGLRVEHPQELINVAQYGRSPDARNLGAAAYRLTHQTGDAARPSRGVYSFCMCPGGFIVPTPTEPGLMAINGMSNSNRSAPYANSGVVVQVTPEDLLRHGFPDSPLAGIALQRALEKATFEATKSPYAAPAMRISEFVSGKAGGTLAPTSFRPGAEPADLNALLPEWISAPLREALVRFGSTILGYAGPDGNIFAVESRTSSPVRLLREADGQAPGVSGLYPAGEGAGYAGGIVSSAVDGLKAAEALLAAYR